MCGGRTVRPSPKKPATKKKIPKTATSKITKKATPKKSVAAQKKTQQDKKKKGQASKKVVSPLKPAEKKVRQTFNSNKNA
ncbi:hypothetical protein GCK72_011495 [Caenorhabditis remanei]|uniref:Uncharacterized protein n=1 Tax=Caenorhabditis remanei TaxID=31234 RepID=A0A6A5H850_CAERE|nr:hypothetical protein GCK72_011495 [Caenorhabditis remanei]KAF1763229.1 hypothetical protein GCK72_011495 [Caenorhabditis remanei]